MVPTTKESIRLAYERTMRLYWPVFALLDVVIVLGIICTVAAILA